MTKEAIYKKYWAVWVNETFVNDKEVLPEDLQKEDEHLWVYQAMEEYANQKCAEKDAIIKDLQNQFMGVQANLQQAQFIKDEKEVIN